MSSKKSGRSSKRRPSREKQSPLASPEAIEAVPCAIYARSAAEENPDPEKQAVAVQQQHCLRAIWDKHAEGWVHRVTLSDPNCSGASPNRLGLQLLIALAETRQIKVVVVQKRERLARNFDLHSSIAAVLHRNGVKVYSCVEATCGDSPLGHFCQSLLKAAVAPMRAKSRPILGRQALRTIQAIRNQKLRAN